MMKKPPTRRGQISQPSELQDLFAELKGEYLETFPEKIAAIREHWQVRNREGLHTEFHKIKGTGTTYGIPEVTAVAELLEEMCEVNHDRLGAAVMVAIDLFQKICKHYSAGVSMELSKDPMFKAIKDMQESLMKAS